MWHCIHRGNALRWFTCLWRAGRSVSIELSFTQLFMIRTDWHNTKHCETLAISRCELAFFGWQWENRHREAVSWTPRSAGKEVECATSEAQSSECIKYRCPEIVRVDFHFSGVDIWFYHFRILNTWCFLLVLASCRILYSQVCIPCRLFCKNHNIIHYSIHYSDHCATATFSKCFETLCLCTGSAPQVRKVLICHASVGSGHSRAAQAWHPGGPGNRGSHDDVNSFGPSCRWRASEGWTCQKVAYGKLVCLTGWLSNYLDLFGWLISPPHLYPSPFLSPSLFLSFSPMAVTQCWDLLQVRSMRLAQFTQRINKWQPSNQPITKSIRLSCAGALSLSLSLSQWFTSSFITYSLTQSFKVWLHRLEM